MVDALVNLHRTWRKWWPELAGLIAVATLLAAEPVISMWSDRPGVATGWFLCVLIVVLMFYGVRKRFPHLPFGVASSWRKWHTMLGWLAMAAFLLHAGVLPPEGMLDRVLWALLVFTLALGALGVVLTRVLPKDLDRGGQRQLFERLPGMAWALSKRCQTLIDTLPETPTSAPVVRYYRLRVLEALTRPLSWRTRLNGRRLKRALAELKAVQKHLAGATYEVASEVAHLLVTRTELERQYRALFWLRLWVEIHLSLAVATVLVMLVHILARYGFRL